MPLTRITITIDEDTLHELRGQVGPGGVSAFVLEAIRARLRRDPVQMLLADLDERFGPLDPHELDEGDEWWQQLNERVSYLTPEP
jgi:hypothetical protein